MYLPNNKIPAMHKQKGKHKSRTKHQANQEQTASKPVRAKHTPHKLSGSVYSYAFQNGRPHTYLSSQIPRPDGEEFAQQRSKKELPASSAEVKEADAHISKMEESWFGSAV